MKLFIPLLATLSSAETDCNKVRRFLYPDAADCPNEMNCSGEYACSVDKDSCDLYKCVSASNCPTGTTYAVFNPQGSTGSGPGHESNNVEGYFCDPDGLTCGFDNDGNFYIDAIVKNRQPWIDGPDDDDEKRKVTLISKTKHDLHVPNTPFKQFHDSTCVGEEIQGGNKVRFTKHVNDPLCKDEFDFSHIFSEINGLTYIVDFYIGFDDYWVVNEFGYEGILRGGVSNQFQCRLKASDNGWIDPNPESSRDYDWFEYDGDIPFSLTAFVDQEFSDEYKGGVIELDDESRNNGLFVEAKHYASDVSELESHIMHLRECTSNNFQKIGEDDAGNPIFEDTPSGTFAFINDGCIDNEIFYYSQKSSRTEWTSKANTYVNDQFNLKVMDLNGAWKIKYSCDMVLCPLDVFGKTNPGSPCHLSEVCPNRYDNLFHSRYAKKSLARNDDKVPIKTFQEEGVILFSDAAGTGSGTFALGFSLVSLLMFTF